MTQKQTKQQTSPEPQTSEIDAKRLNPPPTTPRRRALRLQALRPVLESAAPSAEAAAEPPEDAEDAAEDEVGETEKARMGGVVHGCGVTGVPNSGATEIERVEWGGSLWNRSKGWCLEFHVASSELLGHIWSHVLEQRGSSAWKESQRLIDEDQRLTEHLEILGAHGVQFS